MFSKTPVILVAPWIYEILGDIMAEGGVTD